MEAELNGKERVFHRKLSYVQKVRGILLIQPGNRIQDPETKEPQTLIPNTNILLHQQTFVLLVPAPNHSPNLQDSGVEPATFASQLAL